MKPSKLFIIFCLGLAVSGFAILGFTSFLEKEKSQTIQEAKERALENGLKDEQGKPLVSSDELKQYLLADEEDYQIIYQEKGDFFLISINQSPFNEVRDRAEKHFLSLTQSPPKIACKLNVTIVIPRWANLNYPGQTFPLSFCK